MDDPIKPTQPVGDPDRVDADPQPRRDEHGAGTDLNVEPDFHARQAGLISTDPAGKNPYATACGLTSVLLPDHPSRPNTMG